MVKKTDFDTKVTKIEGKIPDASSLVVTKSALTVVENEIPDVSSLVKRQITVQRLVKLNMKLIIRIMTNTLLLQNLIL